MTMKSNRILCLLVLWLTVALSSNVVSAARGGGSLRRANEAVEADAVEAEEETMNVVDMKYRVLKGRGGRGRGRGGGGGRGRKRGGGVIGRNCCRPYNASEDECVNTTDAVRESENECPIDNDRWLGCTYDATNARCKAIKPTRSPTSAPTS